MLLLTLNAHLLTKHFILKGEALIYPFPETHPARVSSTSPFFLPSNITPHQSLIIETMMFLCHYCLPTVGLVPPAVPPVPLFLLYPSCWAHKRYTTDITHFSLKNKPLSKFPFLYLRNGNGLENSSMEALSRIQSCASGKNCAFPQN